MEGEAVKTKLALRELPVVIRDRLPTASFPVNYEHAKRALTECVNLDECKDWVDKSVALVTYAKQARDESLKTLANRIQLRALARVGELLLDYPGGKGRPRPSYRGIKTRADMARSIGLSQSTGYQAIGIARCPPATRDQLIDRTPVAEKWELIKAGMDAHGIKPRPMRDIPQRPHCQYLLETLNDLLADSADDLLQGIEREDVQLFQEKVKLVIELLDAVQQRLEILSKTAEVP